MRRRLVVAANALLLVACSAPRDAATTSPASTVRAVAAPGELAPPSGVDSLLRLADSVYPQAPDSSTVFFTLALERAGALGDSANVARSLTGLGQAARQTGDFPASRELSERALALKLRLGMRADLFRSYNTLGLLARAAARPIDASAFFA